jgi:hypothetical protein
MPNQVIRWMLRLAALAAIGLIASLGIWYALSFLPHLSELEAVAARGNSSGSNVEKVLYPLAIAGESKERIRSWAVRQAYWSLAHDRSGGGMLTWHANNLLWDVATRAHLNEHQVFGLWVDCAISQCGYGLTEASRKYFGKELSNLSVRELAGLVAAVRNPGEYAPGSERGEKRANDILDEAKAHDPAFDADSQQRRVVPLSFAG